jgi:ribonuclease T2
MKLRILVVAAALLVGVAGCKSRSQGEPGEPAPGGATAARAPMASQGTGFDFYLLNLSWSPEFCFSHPNAAECAAHPAFVLHGLWPENADGSYPEKCSTAAGPADPGQYKDIYPDAGLLAHEWQTHGTCSGLSADAFFETARAAYGSVAIPPRLKTLTAETSLRPDQIVDLFTASNPTIPASSVVVSCGHNYLTAVEVCLDKGLHPTACGAVRSCRANTVRIPAP